MFDLSITMTAWGAVLLIVGALLIGLVGQFIGDARTNFHWLIVGVFAFLGGLVASEFVVDWRAFQPVWEGLALVPALVGGIVIGAIADAVTRYSLGGSYMGTPA